MNTGIIASRYATALLKLVEGTGNGDAVLAQVLVLQKALDSVPDMRRVLNDPAQVSGEAKVSLFKAALDNKEMEPELEKFLWLLVRNDRIGDARLVFQSFVNSYYHDKGIVRAHLTVASPSKDLEERLRKLIESRLERKLLLETAVDPSIIGGFVLEVEDLLLDASVSRQIEIIRRQFVEKNKRIV